MKLIIVFDRQGMEMGGKKVEMKPEILIVKHDGDDFPVVIEPWDVEVTNTCNHIGPMRTSGDGKVREVVTTIDTHNYKPEVIAKRNFHSRLIASAPEMYLALTRALSDMKTADHALHSQDEVEAIVKKVEASL